MNEEDIYKLFPGQYLVRHPVFDKFLRFCFSYFSVANTCLTIIMAAFRCLAFLAFPMIKHDKQQKQHTVFLMEDNGNWCNDITEWCGH